MAETSKQFTRAPKRKAAKGRSVSISPEAKAAYEAEIKERAEREAYLRQLGDSTRR